MPNKKSIGKKITKAAAIVWLIMLSGYASFIVGTLAHELTHSRYGINNTAVRVNFDSSGKATAGAFFRHSHEWVYLQGYIVESTLMLLSVFSICLLMGND